MLYKCYKELDKRFSTVNGKKLKKTERVEQTVLNSVLPVSKAEICDILPDVSPSTVEAVLGKMVKTGSVVKLGQARATKYVKCKIYQIMGEYVLCRMSLNMVFENN